MAMKVIGTGAPRMLTVRFRLEALKTFASASVS
jgi:hypothetical protein